MSEISLSEIIPIREIKGNQLLNSSLIQSIAFKIEYPEVFLQDSNWFNTFHNSCRSFMKLLPEYTILHTITFCDETTYKSKYEDCTNLIEKSRQFNYADRGIPKQEDYVLVTFADKALDESLNSHILNSRKGVFTNAYSKAYEQEDELEIDIESARTSIKSAFPECNIITLEQEETVKLIYKYLSQDYNYQGDNYKLPTIDFQRNKIGEKYISILSMYEGNKSENSRIATVTSTEVINPKRSKFDEVGEINQSLVFPLTVGLPFPHIYSCIIQKLPKQKVKTSIDLELRGLNLPAMVGITAAKNKQKHLDAFESLITDHNFIPVNLSMCLIIPEEDKKTLERKISLAKSAIERINDMKSVKEASELPYLFFANCPGNANQQYRKSYTTLKSALCYTPKESHYRSDNKGFYFTDRFGKPFLLNLLNHPAMTNKNGVVIGPSGRGKSYTLNYIVSLIYSGAHLIIIDKGGSYENLTTLFKGNYYDSSDEEKFTFSLFECERDSKGKYNPDNLHLNFLQTTLLYIWKGDEPIKQEEKQILKDLIEIYYDHINEKNSKGSLIDFEEYIFNNWDNFKEHFEKIDYKSYFDIGSFRLMLRPFVSGSEKNLFNAEKNIDLTYEKFTVFDMKSIEKSNPTKFNLLCILITFLNIKKVQKLPRHIFKSFIIDEALSFLKGNMGEFIGNLFAEVRKENGQVLVVAQGIKYILEASTEVQEKIFSNRDLIIMTNHSGYENSFKSYIELLGFNDKDIELLKSLKLKSEAFIKLGSKPYIVKIEASKEEDGLYTTDPDDMKTMRDLHKKYGSISTAVEVYGDLKRTKQL